MTPLDLRRLRERMRFSQDELARGLGIEARSVKAYEAGRWRSGRPAPIPRAIALAAYLLEREAGGLIPAPYAYDPPAPAELAAIIARLAPQPAGRRPRRRA